MGQTIAPRIKGNSVVAERKFLDFLDMFDGGGAGKMGDKFEGGGVYSMLANALASPYGSEDEARKNARMAAYAEYANNGAPITHQQPQRPQRRPQASIANTMYGGGPDPYADPAKFQPWAPYPKWATDPLTQELIDRLRSIGTREQRQLYGDR